MSVQGEVGSHDVCNANIRPITVTWPCQSSYNQSETTLLDASSSH